MAVRLPAAGAHDATLAGAGRQQHNAIAIVHTKTGRARDCRVVARGLGRCKAAPTAIRVLR
jgi:hypothetical protein